MFISRALILLGFVFVSFSTVLLVMGFFADNADPILPLFALLNGLIAMGTGDILIELKQKNKPLE
ncbi:hypothetical protein SAMN04487944_12830 [Gracilibacillus ureilyticus]|uniref:Uncharacterized protein n=1 Tax=Gracilibacillus ureilyticus TaxID=531814 RepID=A0A1H9VV16_9BACI|nr:hypothetical protein [Gracilibacillus ureilyticus]SES25640.1 hypothetical protein SAMN04487944_12830 [Gracilibacillus ureilyticus]